MIRRGAFVAVGVAATFAFPAGHAAGLRDVGDEATIAQDVPAKAKVLVRDNFFDPRSTQIVEGGRVTWSWRDMNRHNVSFTKVPAGTSRKGSKTLSHGRWKRTFRKPGVYRYVCRLWAGMRGTVTVRKEPAPEP